jgi:sugar lactone lactonase YvrE
MCFLSQCECVALVEIVPACFASATIPRRIEGEFMKIAKLALVAAIGAAIAGCGGEPAKGRPEIQASQTEVWARSITLDADAFGLTPGDSRKVTATLAPANVTNTQVRWESSDTAVAAVDADGNVTGIGEGVARITATNRDLSATATVTVSPKMIAVTGVDIHQDDLTLVVGDTEPLTASVRPATATNAKITWSSADPSISIVGEDGVVRAVAPGETTVGVRTDDGGFTANLSVTVKPAPQPLRKIGVRVSGLQGGAVVLRNNATDRLELTANGNFEFANKAANYSVTVEKQPLGFQYCRVDNGSGFAKEDVTNIAVSCGDANAQASTLAGSGQAGSSDGAGTAASFTNPWGLSVDVGGNVFVADVGNEKVRKVSPSGVVTTIAGPGAPSFANGANAGGAFDALRDTAVDTTGNVYVVQNRALRKITPNGAVSVIASNTSWQLDSVAVDKKGTVYVGVGMPSSIMTFSPKGEKSTLAGSGIRGADDATGTSASFDYPGSVAIDDATGNLYVADYRNNKIRKVAPSGVVTTFAGSGVAGTTDGTGAAASFNGPFGIAVDAIGTVYVADRESGRIRKISPTGAVRTLYTASWTPQGLAVDSNGNLYVSNKSGHAVVKLVPRP